MYAIDGRDVLFDWLSHESNPDQRTVMLEWVAELAIDPWKVARRVPGVLAPVYIAAVPTTPIVVLRFLIAEQFHAIRLIAFVPLP